MAGALILINTKSGAVVKVRKGLEKIDFAKEVEVITGDYDIMVILKAPSSEDIMRTIISEIREMDGVRDTTTYNFVESIRASPVP